MERGFPFSTNYGWFIGSLVHWFIERGNTCLNQDFLDLRIFRIVTYRTHWAMILLDLAIQQEQTEEYISIDGYSIWRLRHTEYAYYYILRIMRNA